MEFRILGPLEARVDGSAVPLGGPRQRAVLAVLLLQANAVVTADQLAAAVWEQPPARPDSNIRTYVAGLRQRLRVAGEDGSRLVTRDNTYLLRVDPGELDLQVFDDAAERGERALRDDDPGAAARCLRDALSLWRGRPLDGLTFGAPVWPCLARIEERRLSTVEGRLRARVGLGEHDPVIGEARDLVARHPLRESLWAVLMLALFRAGRQAEALRAYADARRILADELGADPGPQLRDLHTAILRGELDPAPTPPPSAPAQPAAEVPAQLPADIPGFVGRADAVADLDRILPPAVQHVAAVSGTAGVGKPNPEN